MRPSAPSRAMLGRVLALCAILIAAGCVRPAEVGAATLDELPARVALPDGEWAGALVWNGTEIAAATREGPPLGLWPACLVVSCWEEATCEPGVCERVRFRVDAPEGETARVQVRAQSVRNYTVGPWLRVLGPAGDLVAEGTMTDWLSIALIEEARAGEYEAEVIALYGAGRYDLAVVVERPLPPEEGPARELLPDLVTISPSDLRVESTGDWYIPLPPPEAMAPGCSWGEAIEGMARRCLRFSNGVANVGEGALEVSLAPQDAIGSFAGTGRFVQRIYASDGSVREEPVGAATFHAAHQHYHYAGLATYELYAYDAERKERGELVREGRKAGFCFYDTAMVDITRADVGPQGYDGRGCLDTAASASGSAWYTGVSPGFTDFYGWYLPDQYVEITGIEDGVYELVSIADGYGTLVESDATNNAGSAVFRLTGNAVDVLWTTGA